MSATGSKVSQGDWVVLRVNEGAKFIVIQVIDGADVKVLKKRSFKAQHLIGYSFGDYVELDKANVVSLWDRSNAVQVTKLGEKEYEEIGDNRNIKRNDPSVQQMTCQDIEKLKKDSQMNTAEMIEKVAASNASFSTKTAFSKEKYLKKKQQKHLSFFQILRPTSRTVSEAYFSRGSSKIFFLRPDSLAQLINLANITSGANVLVHESCSGLVIGSIMERLAGHGNLISLFSEQDRPVNNAFQCFNFSEEIKKPYLPMPYHQFNRLANISLEEFEAFATATTSDPSTSILFGAYGRKKVDLLRNIRTTMNEPVDSLIIISKHNPTDVLFDLFPYVRDSGHIVIFHPHIEPLIKCHEMLMDSGEAVYVELRESWFRDYQVLPLRTHPLMKMHGTSGFLLSAIKVAHSERPVSVKQKKGGPPNKRMRVK